MRIVNDYPPMFDEIDARFHVRGKPFLFAWGSVIYNARCTDPSSLHQFLLALNTSLNTMASAALSQRGHDTYERRGEHDDLDIATALVVWVIQLPCGRSPP